MSSFIKNVEKRETLKAFIKRKTKNHDCKDLAALARRSRRGGGEKGKRNNNNASGACFLLAFLFLS